MTGVHLSRIDLNLLVVLATIHEEGGITKAADKLHLTQPAISHALARLRDLFDDPLFVRQGNTMVPTALTRRIIDPVRASLEALETTLAGTERFDPASSQRRFTIGTRAVQEPNYLPALAGDLARSAPAVVVNCVRVDRRRIEPDLASGALDIAIDVLVPVSDAIRKSRLSEDRLVVVIRDGHPAAAGGVDLGTYLAMGHVLVSARRRGGGIEDHARASAVLSRRICLRCQQYPAACEVVSRTDLAVTMPARHALRANAGLGNRILPLPFDAPNLDSYLYWHASAETDSASVWLRERVRSAFQTAG